MTPEPDKLIELIKEWRAESKKNWILLNAGPEDVSPTYAKCADQLEEVLGEVADKANEGG